MPIRTATRGRGATVGARDKFLTIQERPEAITKDPSGTPIDGPWTTHLDSVAMEREDIDGRERFTAQQLTTPYDTRFRLPYVASMDPELLNVPKLRRLVYRGRVLDIVFAKHVGRFEGIELLTVATAKAP
jgi:hypothetical protein